jgi:hypothetical protein
MLPLVTLAPLNPTARALSVTDPTTEMDPPVRAMTLVVGETETDTVKADPVGGLASLKTLMNPELPVSATALVDWPGLIAVMAMPL